MPPTRAGGRAKAEAAELEVWRTKAAESRSEQLSGVTETLKKLLTDLFWTLEGVRDVGRFGTGEAPASPKEADQARLDEFLEKFLGGHHSVAELDIQLPDPDPDPELELDPMEMDQTLPVEAVLEESAAPSSSLSPVDLPAATEPAKEVSMDIDEVVRKEKEAIAQADDVVTAEEEAREGTADEGAPVVPSQKRAANLPPHLRIAPPLPRSQSYNSPTINPGVLLQSPPKQPSSTPQPSNSMLRLHQRSYEYAPHLPPVPQHYVTSRLAVAQPRAARLIKQHRKEGNRGRVSGVGGVWGGSGYTQTLKVLLHGQHAGVKLALGKVEDATGRAKLQKQRIGNTLSTDDWQTALTELKATRALERIDRLKSDKQWSFRQMKKQRVPAPPKAHWDNLLDEMNWLQIDFRQERRWKLVTAYSTARAVQQWHEADAEGRKALQVPVRPPRLLDEDTQITDAIEEAPVKAEDAVEEVVMEDAGPVAGPSKRAMEDAEDVQAGTDVDVDAEGEADAEGEDESPLVSRRASTEALRQLPMADAPVDDVDNYSWRRALTSTSSLTTPLSPKSTAYFNLLKSARQPLLSLGPEDTLIDIEDLDLEEVSQNPRHHPDSITMNGLFHDLAPAAWGDLDARPERRLDESNPQHSKLSNVSQRLESKPLLVSTLNPAKNLIKRRTWANLGHLSTEDVRDYVTPQTHAPPSILFANRKGKEVPSPINIAPPGSAPENAEARAAFLTWSPDEDGRLSDLVAEYGGSAWRLVADVFNASTNRRVDDKRLPWDCFDRYTKTFAPNARIVQADTTIETPAPDGGGPSSAAGARKLAKQLKSPARAEPPKKLPRPAALAEIAKKIKKRRELEERKREPSNLPRQIKLSAHDTHAQPSRGYMTPIDMSIVKAERDRAQMAAAELATRQYAYRVQQQQQQMQRLNGQNPQAAQAAQAAALVQQRTAQAAGAAGQQRQGSQPQPQAGQQRFPGAAGTPGAAVNGGHATPPLVPQIPNMGQAYQMAAAGAQGTAATPAGNGQRPATPQSSQAGGQHPGNQYSLNLMAMAGQLQPGSLSNLQPDQIQQIRNMLSRAGPSALGGQAQQQT